MNKFKFALLLSCVVLLSSCKVQKIDEKFYNEKTVGVAVQVLPEIVDINSQRPGVFSLDYQKKYSDILDQVKVKDFEEDLNKLIVDKLESKNKKYKFIDYFEYNDLSKFKSRNPDRLKEYSRRELRNFKKSHNIDEIIVLRVQYGIGVSITQIGLVLVTGGFNYRNEIVNLEDNSLYQRKFKTVGERIKGQVTPEKAEFTINKAIEKGLEELAEIYK